MVKTWSEEGEERGILRGQRELLLKMLEAKFPDLNEEAKRRLEQLPGERLEEVGVALFTAESLKDLGLAD